MTNFKRLKAIGAILLVAVMVFSMVSCKKDEVKGPEYHYEKRYVNMRFYYSEGYPNEWTVLVGPEDYEINTLETRNGNHDGYLCAKFFPLAEGANGDVCFTVYKYNTKSMMNTLNSITDNLMNPSSDYYLNDVFVEEERPRDSFTFTSQEATPENPNHFQFNTALYSFVRDGEDWKGKFYVSTAQSTWLFLVCVEAKNAKWDESYEIFKLMMEDFAFEGYETEKK